MTCHYWLIILIWVDYSSLNLVSIHSSRCSKTMKDLKKRLKTILKLGIFSGLLLAFIALYLTDIVHKYQDEVTTITTKREPIQRPIWPAITICMEKPFKPSVLKKELGTVFENLIKCIIWQLKKNWEHFLREKFKYQKIT